MTKRLQPCNEMAYAGMSYEQASIRAQEVCRIAGETGQTKLASEHLNVLMDVMFVTKAFGLNGK